MSGELEPWNFEQVLGYKVNPLTPTEFKEVCNNRSTEIVLIEEAIANGKSCIIVGPSGAGKTSVVRYITDADYLETHVGSEIHGVMLENTDLLDLSQSKTVIEDYLPQEELANMRIAIDGLVTIASDELENYQSTELIDNLLTTIRTRQPNARVILTGTTSGNRLTRLMDAVPELKDYSFIEWNATLPIEKRPKVN